MRRIAITSVFLAIIFGIASSATAEIYKYRDDQGIIRYTYDLGEVPEEQRSGIQAYEEETDSAFESPQEEPKGDASAGEPEKKPADDAPPSVDEQKIEELNQKKKDLDVEFAGLMEEKYNLLKEKEKLADSLAGRDTVAVADYDKKVEELNRKIADYQKRREAFQKEAEALKKAVEKPSS
jgi:predicted RNase H-like nuclease (RuvC/YqgF family)